MQLIQSFIYTISRARLSLYEQRLLLKVVEFAQQRTSGLLIKNNLQKLDHDFANVQISVPISDILGANNQHYERVRDAAFALCSRVIKFYDSDRDEWFASSVIYNAKHKAKSGILEFYVSKTLFDVILDFSRGYRSIELDTALKIANPYALRLYSIMAGQGAPIVFSVNELREMFGLESKYTQTADLIKYTIEPARKELDKHGCTSFTIAPLREGQKITAIRFFPKAATKVNEKQLKARVNLSFFLSKELRVYLIQKAGFTSRELGAHKSLLEEFVKMPDCAERLEKIYYRFAEGNKTKGYIIAAMKSAVLEYTTQTTVDSAICND